MVSRRVQLLVREHPCGEEPPPGDRVPREPLLFDRTAPTVDDPASTLRKLAHDLPIILAMPAIAEAIRGNDDLKHLGALAQRLHEIAVIACGPAQFAAVLHRGISTIEALITAGQHAHFHFAGTEQGVLEDLRSLAESVLIGTNDDETDDEDSDEDEDDPELQDEEHVDGREWTVISRTDDSRTYALQVGQEPSVRGTLVRTVSRSQTGSEYGESTSALQWLPGVSIEALQTETKPSRKPEKRRGSR